MILVPHIRFQDLEQSEFTKIASISVLCDTSVEDKYGKMKYPRLNIVRRAAQGDLLSPQGVKELMDALDGAIVDRGEVVKAMRESGHEPLAEAAESWYGQLRLCLAYAELARTWVGPVIDEED